MFGITLKRLQLNDIASAALILLALSLVIQVTHLFDRVDNLVFDLGQKLITTPAPDDIVLVVIDQNSLSHLGRWPWSRNTHAALLNRLKQEHPAVIGLDIIFSEADQRDPMADSLLAQAIKDSGNVVLPVLMETTRTNGQIIETLPLPALMAHVADVGRVHTELDDDSIARSVYLYEGLGSPAWQLFAQAIDNVSKNKPSQNRFESGATGNAEASYALFRKDQRRVNFLGPPGHFLRISYVQVLNGEFIKGLFENKIVLVGATALGMNDLLTTPVSGLGLPMSGVEFHANVLESIRKHQLIQFSPVWLTTILVMIVAVLPLLWMPKLSALWAFLSTLCFMMLITIFSGLLPKLIGVWIPPSAALVSLLLAYPIWSWRKLEAAQKFLDFELEYLKQNLVALPTHAGGVSLDGYDKFDTRIAQVRIASQQLRFLQNDRKETLAFISHDLRAPLASALMALEQESRLSTRLHKSLSQALSLAEDFLQASRAEMIEVSSFNEIDFAGLVHQAVDDAYDAAILKSIVLQREIVEGIVWVRGNFGLLHRALLNLILNAVKYSPPDALVVISLQVNQDKTMATFSVIDHGPGIPFEEQARLFKRFSRIKSHEKIAEGAGLGLYFVRTVTEKHQGTIQVQSDLGQPTKFSMHLPMTGFLSHDY
ncbi:MAG TPA: histidine kinase [Methylophilaceae bacterium]|nr:histidine kinase [Methylophilaceae bacterium]